MTPFGEHPADGVGAPAAPTVLVEDQADFAGGAVAVVGEGIDQDGDTAGAVAFVVDLIRSGCAPEFAGAFFDGFVDGVVGHVHGAGLVDGEAKREVVIGVGAALGGDHDEACDLGPRLAAAGVDDGFFAFDVFPV